MNCQKCGAQIPEGAKFCTECGAPVPREAPAQPAASQEQPRYIPPQPQAPVQQPQSIPPQPQAPVQQPQSIPPQPQAPVQQPQSMPSQPQAPVQQPQYRPPQPQVPGQQPQNMPVQPQAPAQQGQNQWQAPGQPVYRQQQYQAPRQFVPAPAKKKSKAPVIILVAVLAVALIVGAVFLLPQLLGLRKNTPPEQVPTPPPAEVSSVPESSSKPEEQEKATPTPEPAESEDSFPTSVKNVPDGMRVVRLGSLSLAVPEDYEMEDDYDDELTFVHPDVPLTIAQIMLAREEDMEPGEEEEGIEELKENIGNITEEKEYKGKGYTCSYFKGEMSAEELGMDFTTHCYIFIMPGELHAVAIMTDNKDQRIEQVMKTIAFDPNASGTAPASTEEEKPSSAQYQAKEDPTLQDFNWAINLEDLKPEKYHSSPEEIEGRWKCCLYYDDMDAYEFFNAEFSASKEDVKLELEPCFMQYNGEPPIDESGEYSLEFYGKFEGEDLSMTGSAKLECSTIYTCKGKQYFVGYLTLQSGEIYMLWMVRP